MKKAFQISFLTIIAMALIVSIAFAGSEVFQISVTIPSIPGVNSPAEVQSTDINAETIAENKAEWDSLALAQDIDFTEIKNGNKRIIIQTITDY